MDKKTLMKKTLAELRHILQFLDIPGRSNLNLGNKLYYVKLITKAPNKDSYVELEVEDCDVKSDCPKGYSRYELTTIAKNCSIKLSRKRPLSGQKTMAELCYDLSGGKIDNRKISSKIDTVPKQCHLPKNCMKLLKSDVSDIAKLCKISLHKLNKSGKLIKKQKKELCDDLSRKDYKINEISKNQEINSESTQIMSPQEIKIALKKLLPSQNSSQQSIILPSENSEQQIQEYYNSELSVGKFEDKFETNIDKDKRICANEHNELYGNVYNIPKNKFVKLSSGYCYDIDGLLEKYMNTNERIFKDENEFKKFILLPNIDPRIRAKYGVFARKQEINKIKKETGFRPDSSEIINRIGNLGFIILTKNNSEYVISYMKKLLNDIKSSEDSNNLLNYKYKNKYNLSKLLNTRKITKINDLGIKLLNLYISIYKKFKKYTKLIPEIIEDKNTYYTFKINDDTIPLKNNKVEKDMLKYSVTYNILVNYGDGFIMTNCVLKPKGNISITNINTLEDKKILKSFSKQNVNNIYNNITDIVKYYI